MSKIEKTEMKKLDVTNAYEVDCSICDRSFIIDDGKEEKPKWCPYCGTYFSHNDSFNIEHITNPAVTINGTEIPVESVSIKSHNENITYSLNGLDRIAYTNPRYSIDIDSNDWRL